jgi:catechol 2,3-dioxygenase-like lactoylglutathione lyase family enzyme
MASKQVGSVRVASIPVVVSDRVASKQWYTEKLGMRVVDEEGHWVTVGGIGPGTVLHLCQASENHPHPIPLEPGSSGIVLALSGEFQEECRRLQSGGIEFTHPPEKAPWGWYATIRDPDGNEHYLMPSP